MKILYVFADSPAEWNCAQWRCLSPSDVFNARGHQASMLWLPAFANFGNRAIQDLVGPSELIVVQRNFFRPEIWDAMDYWRGLGKTVVTDLDDGYPLLPWSNMAHAFWIENKSELEKPPIEMMREGFSHCDALLSPSQVILDDWKEEIPGILVPNYAPRKWFKNLTQRRPPKDPNKVVIGWGGSMSHYDSWWFSGIQQALTKVCDRHPEVYIKICGNDQRLIQQLDIPDSQKIYQGGVAPQQWSEIVATFDIGVAPLDLRDGEKSYDNRRSWIKAAEYMLVGIPWIASDATPYSALRKYGALIGNEDWESAIEDCLTNLSVRRKQARDNKRWAMNNLTLESSLHKIIESYERAILLTQIPNIPAVLRVPATNSVWTEEEEGEQPTFSHEARCEIQNEAFATALNWHLGELDVPGDISLGYGMQYDLLQRLNKILLDEKGLFREQ